MRNANSSAITVSTGSMAFFSAWRERMSCSQSPLARAVRM